MDNGTFHKGTYMVKALESVGYTLFYLPPYFQDMNFIEKKWAHVKSMRRRLGWSVEELFQKENP